MGGGGYQQVFFSYLWFCVKYLMGGGDQQVFFSYLWFCVRYHENSAEIKVVVIHRQFFENEFISIAKTMEFEYYSER